MDYQILRKRMVEEQLIPRGIKDQKVLDAFYKVERHRFVPEALITSAYADYPLPIGNDQTISQPYIAALMTEALDLAGNEKVLEIGTGSGYQAAILAELAREVFTIERFEDLSKRAMEILGELGYTNIKADVGDGTLGWPQEAPFDRVIITAASPEAPLSLITQLNDPGKLIIPLGEHFNQVLTLVEKQKGKFKYSELCNCTFVPLVGKYAG